MKASFRCQLFAAVAIVLACVGQVRGEELAATPYRPTVANPAELPVPGWLEIEAGGLKEYGRATKRDALPYTAKLAFSEDWGVLLGGDLHVREREGGETVSGAGDVSLLLKHRIALDERRAFGVEAGVNLPTAEHDLGSGKPDWILTGIYSVDLAEDWRLDLNAGVTRVGALEAGQGRMATSWAASVSHNLQRWTLATELSGSHQSGANDSVQALAAVSYAFTPKFVIDLGASLQEQDGHEDHALFFGVTWLTHKLF